MEGSSRRRRTPAHIYGLDGLRALAIIGVTLFHMFPHTIKGGYLGVSLFFVITGYLLALTSERRSQQGKWRILPYYLKRIQRIYPGLLIMLFVTVGVYFFLVRPAIAGVRPELRSIILGYNNWWQIAQNADYFTRITNASPFTPMWFLGIEMQFYLLWPLIFGIFMLLAGRKGDRAGLYFILALTLLSAVLTPVLYRPGNDVTRLYYGTDTRIYGLLFGVLLGMLQKREMLPLPDKKTAQRIALPLLAAIIVITWIAYVKMDGQRAFAYRGGMLLMTLLFGVLLILVTDSRLPVGEWLEIQPLVWIGKNSYEIYLWQYPVIYLFMYKRWSDIPVMPVFELILIVVLAAWLHWLTDVILSRRIPSSVMKAERRRQIAVVVSSVLTVFLFFTGVAGAATAPAEKFAQKDELEQRLKENQKMLEETQNGNGASADGSSTTGTSTGTAATSGTADGDGTRTPAGAAGATGANGAAGGTKSAADMDLLYADPSLTNAAECSTEGVLMIGDSIMLDSSPAIKEQLPDCYIDAVQSRQLVDSIDVAQDLINEGHLNKTAVISLGTNGPIQEDDARDILDVFGPDVSVFWVNLFGRTVTWEKESNQLLLDLRTDYPNLTVIDWASLIKVHDEWLWEDGEHPNPEGSEVFATLIRESIEVCEANR
ncbi:MAG: acetyltransferase [Eubacterium sp.]|nr:acetyltransferase [Eubacterium sp.]